MKIRIKHVFIDSLSELAGELRPKIASKITALALAVLKRKKRNDETNLLKR